MAAQRTAIVTGASRGLGWELSRALVGWGWRVAVDARGASELERAAGLISDAGGSVDGELIAIPGEVADATHRRELIDAAGDRIDLLVNNASVLGPSPQPALADYPLAELERVYAVNVHAPLALAQLALPRMVDGDAIVNITSDAAAEPYEGWGGYGSSKAALEQLSAILAAENPRLRIYAVDPGDMRTRMHQQAFPGEDITDRPPPSESVPGLLELIEGELPSGRYRAADLVPRGRVSTAAFTLPPELEASEPPEDRGLARDEVRLMVVSRASGEIVHTCFRDLPEFLAPGDLLVVNNSATLPAAVPARLSDGEPVELRFATPAPFADREGGETWVVELRSPDGAEPHRHNGAREQVELPGGATAAITAPYAGGTEGSEASGTRLWLARIQAGEPVEDYLLRYGHAIRYAYVPDEHPLRDYQTVFALEPGSAEMPSAARPFTPELVTALVSRGIQVAPITLHAGVSSPEHHEPPTPECFDVPEPTARLVNAAARVIAVGTTVVRALETVAQPDGTVTAGHGWTNEIISPDRGLRAIDGLITGWHEPQASHLRLLDAALGEDLRARTYTEAQHHGYLWHEFGDAQLVLP